MAPGMLPEGRYGRRARRHIPRWANGLLVGLVVLAGLAVALVAYRNLGSPPIEGERLSYRIQGDGALAIRFQVTRDEPDRAGVCIVRARSLDGDETGRREVLVPPGQATIVVETVVRTSRPPVAGDVYGCSYSVPAYLTTRTDPERPERPG